MYPMFSLHYPTSCHRVTLCLGTTSCHLGVMSPYVKVLCHPSPRHHVLSFMNRVALYSTTMAPHSLHYTTFSHASNPLSAHFCPLTFHLSFCIVFLALVSFCIVLHALDIFRWFACFYTILYCFTCIR